MIFGLETNRQLPANWTPIEAVAVVKCLDEDGDVSLYLASTKSLSAWEEIGMLTAALDTTRTDLRQGFEPDGNEEEDDE